jgi:hypothetical protein
MELSRDLIRAVVGPMEVRPDGAESPLDGCQRRQGRTTLCGSVTIYDLWRGQVGEALPVGVRDISTGGICILQYQEMMAGQKFIAELPVPGAQPARVVCQVKYCHSVNEELLAIGAEFVGTWTGALPATRAA